MSEIVKRIIEYESRFHAISDCLILLKANEDMPVSEMLKIIRKLSNKQFKLIFKRNKLIRYM